MNSAWIRHEINTNLFSITVQNILKFNVNMKSAWIWHEFNTNLASISVKALWKESVQIITKPFVVCLFHFWTRIVTIPPKNKALPRTPNHQPKPPVLSLLIPCRIVSQGLPACCLCINMDLNREGFVPTVDGSEILHHLGCIAPTKYWDNYQPQLVQDLFHLHYLQLPCPV